MQSVKRKREVSSCIPCHMRKQKCDRQYPCNRCGRRRRPELCAYYSFQSQPPSLTQGLVTPPERSRNEDTALMVGDACQQNNINGNEPDEEESSATPRTPCRKTAASTPLTEAFGYDGRSECNTMALVRKLVPEDDGADTRDTTISGETVAQVRKALDMMPNRQIIDFLVRYFVTEVNWIEQLLYPPWFLSQYQQWWGLHDVSTISDIEFVILTLRVCCYASEFLPSPNYAIDSVKGVPLVEIRRSCEQVVQLLNPICVRLDPRGSLVRVQHIAYGGLAAGSVGRMNGFWESVSCASRVAQRIGLHLDSVISASSTDEMEKEMRRRTFCNLYIWDSYLSRHLDRIPFLSDSLNADILPRMRLLPDSADLPCLEAPNTFTERILRARLAQFWRSNRPPRSLEWDVMAAEERYEEFCSSYLAMLPPAYALEPDKQWDERVPTLPMKRQLLHIATFELICWNFRPTLTKQPDEIGRLPLYKQIMIAHAKRALAAAALSLLQSVADLYKLMGGSRTRFSGIIVPMFEAAVPLLCLCADQSFPGDPIAEGRAASGRNPSPLCIKISKVTREVCMQATREALDSLEMLSEVSEVAEVGAQTLARLISRVDSLPPQSHQGSGATASDGDFDPMAECVTVGGQGIFPFGNEVSSSSWADLLGDWTDTFGIQMESVDFTKRGNL